MHEPSCEAAARQQLAASLRSLGIEADDRRLDAVAPLAAALLADGARVAALTAPETEPYPIPPFAPVAPEAGHEPH